jgi:hypothetical protein
MSFVSCENSGIIHPASYPLGSIGAIITPAINTVAVAGSALLQPIAATLLPQGRWVITGTLDVNATTALATLTGGATGTGIAKNAVVFWRSSNTTAIADQISITLSGVVDSDGTALITIPMTYATSGGSTYGVVASPLSVVQFTRVA